MRADFRAEAFDEVEYALRPRRPRAISREISATWGGWGGRAPVNSEGFYIVVQPAASAGGDAFARESGLIAR